MAEEFSLRVAALKRWVVNQALLATPVTQLATGFADRLSALGLPIWRAHVGFSTLHPQVESIGLTWTREGKREKEEYEHGSFAQVASSSPFYDVIMAAQAQARVSDDLQEAFVPMARYRLERGEGVDAYSMLAMFRAAGGTDYLCFIITFGNEGKLSASTSGTVVSLTSDRPGGFTDDEIALCADLMPYFGAAVRAGAEPATTRTLLDVYLGRDVGRRVLDGEVRRGEVSVISAAILVGDLRGFTTLADEVPRERLVGMLDDYLDCLITPIEEHGGQVLKFLGDGLLATFAFAGRAASPVCAKTLAAATGALRKVEDLNSRRRREAMPVMTLDLALHAGDVLYGNVGSDRRLDFTIVGPAVNEAARLEAPCSTLDVPLLASRRFVDLLGMPDRFQSRGLQTLRGVRAPVEVFALAG